MKRNLLPLLTFIVGFLLMPFSYAKELPNINNSSGVLQNCEITNQCFVFSYNGYVVSPDGQQVTITFTIKTNCNRDLSYAAFQLPASAAATATGTPLFKYTTEITSNPFSSIKFEGAGINGYKNGVSDVFKYVMSKAAFDQLTTIKVQAKAGTYIGYATFDKNCNIPDCVVGRAPTNVTYVVNGVTFSSLQNAVQQGVPVKVCFNVLVSTGYNTYSLVSYKAPNAVFSIADAYLQEVFDYETITVGPQGGSNICLEVNVPNCFYQVDFVKGCIITKFPAVNYPTGFYAEPPSRLLAHTEGGTVPCVPTETLGDEGCTPGYWKQEQHFGNWAPSIPTGTNATKFFDVFTVCDQFNNCSYQGLPADLTLLEALNLNGGDFYALARHAASAYLNSTNDDVDFGLSKNDIIVGVVNAFKTGNLDIKATLEQANEKNCPLARSLETTITSSSTLAAEEQGLATPNKQQKIYLTAFLNPSSNIAVVNFRLNKTENYTVNLYDIQGRMVRQLKTGTAKAGELNQVNVEGKAGSGLYLVKLATKSASKTIKLVLTN